MTTIADHPRQLNFTCDWDHTVRILKLTCISLCTTLPLELISLLLWCQMYYNSGIQRCSGIEGQTMDEYRIIKNWKILTQKYHWVEQIIQKIHLEMSKLRVLLMQYLMYLIHCMNTLHLRYSGYENNKPPVLVTVVKFIIRCPYHLPSTYLQLHTHNEAEKCISYQFLTSSSASC